MSTEYLTSLAMKRRARKTLARYALVLLLSLTFRLLLFAGLALILPPGTRLWILFGELTALTLTFTVSFVGRYAVRSGRWPTDRID